MKMGMVRSKTFNKNNDDNGSDGDSNDSSNIYVVPKELKIQLEVSVILDGL